MPIWSVGSKGFFPGDEVDDYRLGLTTRRCQGLQISRHGESERKLFLTCRHISV